MAKKSSNKISSSKMATVASKALKSKKSSKTTKRLAGSVLSQSKRK